MTVHEVCHHLRDDGEPIMLPFHLLRCDSASSISYVYHKPVSCFSLMFVRLKNNLQDKSSSNFSFHYLLPSLIRSSKTAPLHEFIFHLLNCIHIAFISVVVVVVIVAVYSSSSSSSPASAIASHLFLTSEYSLPRFILSHRASVPEKGGGGEESR